MRLHATGSEAADFVGGVVQRVPVEAGTEHVVTTSMKIETRRPRTAVTLRMGVDPTGQTADGGAGTVLWTGDLVEAEHRETDIWYESAFRFVPDGPAVSTWISGVGDGPVRLSLDDVRVEEVAP